jgi:pimeloyl-ACP methyl ester carboxylesterase
MSRSPRSLSLPALLLAATLTACGPHLTSAAVNVAGRTLEVVEAGDGGTTVVFEAGLGNDWSAWDAVASEVAVDTRVFAYSRPGYGRSAASPSPRTATHIVEELRALLTARGAKPPYVLVGHSFGGTYQELFARLHPEEVAGLVLVEARAAGFGATCEERGFTGCSIPRSAWAGLPAPQGAELEGFDFASDELRAAGAFGPFPVRVLLATSHGLAPAAEALWLSMGQSLAAEAVDGKATVFQGAGHNLEVERAHDVAAAILMLVRGR